MIRILPAWLRAIIAGVGAPAWMLVQWLFTRRGLVVLAFAAVILGWLRTAWQLDDAIAEAQAVRTQAAEAAAAYDAERAAAAAALAKLTEDYRAREQKLVQQAEAHRRIANEQIATARATAAAIRERLRHEPALPSVPFAGDLPSAASPAPAAGFAAGTHGAVLSGSAQFLVDEAERADTLRAHLVQCRTMYKAVKSSWSIAP